MAVRALALTSGLASTFTCYGLDGRDRAAGRQALHGIGIAISFLFPTVAVTLYFATALYLGLPARTVHRLLRRRWM